MLLSVVVPVLNEEKYINGLLDSLLSDTEIEKEILLVDGGSTDRTIELINSYRVNHPNVKVVPNPDKYVSHGFNKAYRQSTGKYITLLGAHTVYGKDFFKSGIAYLERDECDVVGGPLHQDGKTATGKSIAHAMSSKFGVGGTEFRTEKKKMYVDSVAFAIYKRTVFEKAGLLDEELIRNQDDELHYRLNAHKFRILMVPEMESTYYVRGSLSGLFKQYYQYGYYKPLVLKKVKSGIRIRHLVPAAFMSYMVTLPLAILWPVWLLPLVLYMLMDVYFSFSKNKQPFGERLTTLLVFPTLHISYGAGFIRGLKFLF